MEKPCRSQEAKLFWARVHCAVARYLYNLDVKAGYKLNHSRRWWRLELHWQQVESLSRWLSKPRTDDTAYCTERYNGSSASAALRHSHFRQGFHHSIDRRDGIGEWRIHDTDRRTGFTVGTRRRG